MIFGKDYRTIKRATKMLQGKRVSSALFADKEEMAKYEWPDSSLILILEDGSELYSIEEPEYFYQGDWFGHGPAPDHEQVEYRSISIKSKKGKEKRLNQSSAANRKFSGLRIELVRYMTTEERDHLGWIQLPIVLQFNDGSTLIPVVWSEVDKTYYPTNLMVKTMEDGKPHFELFDWTF